MAGQALRSSKATHVFDQLLVKEPGSGTPTRWHHDAPYWPLAGSRLATAWLALDPVSAETGAMRFVKGSHKWGTRFQPVAFSSAMRYDTPEPPVMFAYLATSANTTPNAQRRHTPPLAGARR